MAKWNRLNRKTLEKQYKDHLSDFRDWLHLDHSEDYLLFPENIGSHLSIDETSLSNGELYTIVTNKAAKGKKGALVAIIKGIKAAVVSDILMKIPMKQRLKVQIITLDMSNAMDWIARQVFTNAKKVIDRFHAQKLVTEALQQMRIKERWKAIEQENQEIKLSREKGLTYHPFTYNNGDTKKQLLARSRYLLFKPSGKWSEGQSKRAAILFDAFPELKKGYELSMMFRSTYQHSKTRDEMKKKLERWYEKVISKSKQSSQSSQSSFKSFLTAVHSIKSHEGGILNYFPEKATNASAESFNAKIKGFRAMLQGVKDKKFFLFRLCKIYA